MPNVLLIEQHLDQILLEQELRKQRFHTEKIGYATFSGRMVKTFKPDLVIFNLETPDEQLMLDLRQINQYSPVPVIIFASMASPDIIDKVLAADVSAFIINGLSLERLNTIIAVALARFRQQQTLKESLEEARTKLEDRKRIDRAKAILIKAKGVSEDEAYHTLRKLAMSRNVTLGKIARDVIGMAELLK